MNDGRRGKSKEIKRWTRERGGAWMQDACTRRRESDVTGTKGGCWGGKAHLLSYLSKRWVTTWIVHNPELIFGEAWDERGGCRIICVWLKLRERDRDKRRPRRGGPGDTRKRESDVINAPTFLFEQGLRICSSQERLQVVTAMHGISYISSILWFNKQHLVSFSI